MSCWWNLLEFYPKFNGVKIGWELVTGKQAQLSFNNIFPRGQTSKSNQRANPPTNTQFSYFVAWSKFLFPNGTNNKSSRVNVVRYISFVIGGGGNDISIGIELARALIVTSLPGQIRLYSHGPSHLCIYQIIESSLLFENVNFRMVNLTKNYEIARLNVNIGILG